MTVKCQWSAVILVCVFFANHSVAFDINIFKKEPLLQVQLLDPFIELRTGPSRGFPIFFAVEKGQTITILKRRTDWYKVETSDNKTGWVKRDTLKNTLGPDGDKIDFALPDWQNYVYRHWEMGVLGGDFAGAKSYTGYISYHFTHNIAAELSLTEAFGFVSSSQLTNIRLVHQMFPEWKISPFFTLGAGTLTTAQRSSLVQEEDTEDPAFTVGFGATYYATRRFLLRLEYNNHTILTTLKNNEEVEEWKAGFSVFF